MSYFQDHYGFAHEDTYHNPIRQGFFPDPSIVRVGMDYYMVNSTFVYFPCIPISHSRDLIHWEIIGYAITKPEWSRLSVMDGGMGYWAPDISYCDGRFYITATLRCNDNMKYRRIQMVTSSDTPEGPYEEPVFLPEDGIDPSIFHDDDGRHYMLLNRGARIRELAADCKSFLDDGRLLWYGDYRRKPEGPHLLKHSGYYYLFLAEGGTGMGHRITVARSKELLGVYEPSPYNPIVRQTRETAAIQCTGHGKPVQLSDGSWCIVYLCLRKPDGEHGFLGRETCLDPMTWTLDGWPLVNGGRGPSDQQRKPLIEVDENLDGKGNLKEECFVYPRWQNKTWMTPRPMETNQVFLEKEDVFGPLRLKGSSADLCQKECRSIFLLRQDKFDFLVECEMNVPKLQEGQDLGLTCYYDENSYIKFGVGVREGVSGILLEEYVGDGYRSHHFMYLSDIETLQLKIETRFLERRFFFRRKEESWVEIRALTDTAYLCSEGLKKGKRFTGAMVGFYVHGEIEGRFIRWQGPSSL